MKVARSLKSCLRRDDQGRLTSGLAGLPIANIFHTNVILQARPISFFSPTVFRHTTWPHISLWGGLRKLLWFVSQGLVGVRWVGAEKSTLLYEMISMWHSNKFTCRVPLKKVPFRIYHGRDQSALGQIIIFTCSSRRYLLSPGWLASWDGQVEIMIWPGADRSRAW